MIELPFVLKTFPRSDCTDGVDPQSRAILHETGVPERFIGARYRADPNLRVVEAWDRGALVRFGSSGLGDAICLDPRTGEVVEVIDARRAPTSFVNSTLGQFTETVRAVLAEFPYYDAGASDADVEQKASLVESVIRKIDSAATEPDRYWSAFVDDMSIGDLATDGILRIVQESL